MLKLRFISENNSTIFGYIAGTGCGCNVLCEIPLLTQNVWTFIGIVNCGFFQGATGFCSFVNDNYRKYVRRVPLAWQTLLLSSTHVSLD